MKTSTRRSLDTGSSKHQQPAKTPAGHLLNWPLKFPTLSLFRSSNQALSMDDSPLQKNQLTVESNQETKCFFTLSHNNYAAKTFKVGHYSYNPKYATLQILKYLMQHCLSDLFRLQSPIKVHTYLIMHGAESKFCRHLCKGTHITVETEGRILTMNYILRMEKQGV